jgi:HSP20 family protein
MRNSHKDFFNDDILSPMMRDLMRPMPVMQRFHKLLGSDFEQFQKTYDVKDLDDHYEVSVRLPGYSKDDINLTVKDGVLTVAATVKSEEKDADGNVTNSNSSTQNLSLSFDAIEDDQTTANFKDGLLTVNLVKVPSEEADDNGFNVPLN